MKRRNFLAAAVVAAGSLCLPSVATAQESFVMKLGTGTLNDSQHEWMNLFAQILGDKSGGRIKVEVYPASQLGASGRMIEQTQMNLIQGVVTPPEFLAGIDSRFQALAAPGLFDDLAHTQRTLDDPEFNTAFLGLGADQGLMGIGLFISGPTAFASKHPWVKPEDFAGSKIRVGAADLQMAQVRALGGTPIPMPPSEVLPALQQGTLDGVLSCIPVLEGLGYMDGAKYFIETNHGVIASIAAISRDFYEELPADLQPMVIEAGREATTQVYDYSLSDIEQSKKDWVAKGGEVVELTADQRKALMEVLLPVGPQVTQGDANLNATYELLKAAIERARQG